MAITARLKFSFGDSDERFGSMSINVSIASAQAYVAAVDDAGRDATQVGALINATLPLSQGILKFGGIEYGILTDNFAFPASGSAVYRGNKLVVRYSGSGRRFTVSIPARNHGNLLVVGVDAVRTTQLDAFATAFDAVALDVNGNPAVFASAKVND